MCVEPPQDTLSESDGNLNGLLASWSSGTSNADFTVAQDGSGTHKTITEAVNALAAMDHSRPARPVVYVKSGVYNEKVEIGVNLKNVMFVGDGIDQTMVTGNKNVIQGDTTISSATFGKSHISFRFSIKPRTKTYVKALFGRVKEEKNMQEIYVTLNILYSTLI